MVKPSMSGRFVGIAVLVVAAGLVCGPAPLGAQAEEREGPRPGEISRDEMMQRILHHYERRMVRELGLTSIQLDRIQTVMGEFRPLRYALMEERRELRKRVRDAGASGLGSGEAENLLDRFQALRERELELQREEERRLLETLNAQQLLHLQLIREDLGVQIRRLDARTRSRSRPEGRSQGDHGEGHRTRPDSGDAPFLH
jgi:Spy/CpxP family protein refolding chaperone